MSRMPLRPAKPASNRRVGPLARKLSLAEQLRVLEARARVEGGLDQLPVQERILVSQIRRYLKHRARQERVT